MYNASETYMNFINNDNNLGRSSKSKIVLDENTIYQGNIKSSPKITHQSSKMIGTFASKICEFELFNREGTVNLNGKEVEVFRGIDIDGTVEWVSMGLFTAKEDDITTDATNKTVKFKGYDRALLYDVVYSSSLDWTTSHTGLEIVQEICNYLGQTLETPTFNFASHTFTSRPNFASNITCREVIARIAEIGGEIATISRIGGLRIAGTNVTNQTVSKSKREKLTKENEFKINTVVLGKEGIDDDIVEKNQTLIDSPKTRNILDYNNLTKSTSTSSTDNPARRGTLETHPGGFKYTASEAHGNCFIAQYIFNGTGDVFLKGDTVDRSIRVYVYSDNLWGTQIKNFSLATGSTFSVNGRTVIGFYYSSTGVGDIVDVYDLQLEYGTSGTQYIEYSTWGVQEWRIEDNPFVDLIRESIIEEVAGHIIGTSITPYTLTNFVDDYIYDLNDIVNVVDNNGDTFAAVILNYKTANRIKSDIEAEVQTEATTNYSIAGSTKQQLADVRFQVDHNTGEITSLTTRTEEVEEHITNLENAIDLFSVDLSSYNLVIPTDSDQKPLVTDNFDVNFYAYYSGQQVTPTVSVEGSATGITVTETNTYIRFSVSSTTAITNALNDFSITFTYISDDTTYTLTKYIDIALAIGGSNGSQGPQGPQGNPGTPGTPGTSTYFYVRYSANANGNPMTSAPTATTKYMGVASTTSSTAPTSYTAYVWSEIKGEDGQQGTPGTPGEDGKSSYLHIKYSDDGATFTDNGGETPGRYRGELVDFIQEDSTVFSDYTWYDMGLIVDEELAEIRQEIITNTTQITQNQEQILMEALQEYVSTGDFDEFKNTVSTQFQQTADTFEFNFSNITTQINKIDGATQEQFTEISKYIRFVNGTIELGEVGNPIILKIENDEVAFYQNNNKVAYLTNSKMLITDAEILNSLTIGKFAWIPRQNGNLSLVRIGGNS